MHSGTSATRATIPTRQLAATMLLTVGEIGCGNSDRLTRSGHQSASAFGNAQCPTRGSLAGQDGSDQASTFGLACPKLKSNRQQMHSLLTISIAVARSPNASPEATTSASRPAVRRFISHCSRMSIGSGLRPNDARYGTFETTLTRNGTKSYVALALENPSDTLRRVSRSTDSPQRGSQFE